jgi:hypothetical protein
MLEMVSIFIFAYWVSKSIIAFFQKDSKGNVISPFAVIKYWVMPKIFLNFLPLNK